MPTEVYSEHGDYAACWFDLHAGQRYRLTIQVWEERAGSRELCRGALLFNLGDYQRQFDEAGGVPAAFGQVAITVTDSQWCDVQLIPSTLGEMRVSLSLQALNGRHLGEPYSMAVAPAANSSFSLMLSYAD